MDEPELESFKQLIFDYYRREGFPYYNLSIEQQQHELDVMNKYFENNEIIENDVIKQTMHCLGTAWTYFPHAWSIKSNGKKTPMELFNNDELFKNVIEKRLKRGTYVSDSGIRKSLKSHTGAQGVSNFRPSAGRAIYDKYAGAGRVYDPCMGFGGRLIGAVSSPKVKTYIGCDPSEKTFAGLTEMGMNIILGQRDDFNYQFHKGGSEFYEPENIDLVFTSPPYFDTERYSDEPTQSCNAYPKYTDWFLEFLFGMIDKSIQSLKVGGYFILNIANVKSAPHLEEDFQDMMWNYSDMKLETILKLALSSINTFGHKYEPVFVYRKGL